MNDRTRAINILKKARDLLAERLTDRVVEASDEIFEDAEGLSYMGEIESMYDQMGQKLMHLTQMISILPPQKEEAKVDAIPKAHLPPAALSESTDTAGEESSSIIVSQSEGTDLPDAIVPTEPSQPAPITFQTFAVQIQSGDINGAGDSLAFLFSVDTERGVQCAEVFAERLANDPNIMLKAMKVRQELMSDRFNGAIMLLFECFGLTGLESIGVMQALRVQLSRGA